MENRIIKNFCFQEEFRKQLTFSDVTKIRLNTEDALNQRVMLKGPTYSTDNDIYVETWLLEANALKKWLGFEIIFKEGENPLELPAGTSIGVRLKTTAGHYWFDTGDSTWKIAGVGQWNTDSEIRANIETFPIATIGNKKLGVVVNLKTTDSNVTPEIYAVKLLGLFDVEPFDDLVYDSVIRLLNKNFRATSTLMFQVGSSSISSQSLNAVLENKGYNIFDVKYVYDLTNDPQKLNNLHGSYAVGALKQDGFTYEMGTETFTQPIPANSFIEIVFEYVPEISVKVNQDYFEEPTYPHLVIHRITEVERRGFIMRNTNGADRDFIRNKEAGMAVQHQPPSQKSYRFDVQLFTTEIDQFRLLDAIRRFFANTKKLVTYGLGNEHAIEIVEEIDTAGNKDSDSSDTNIANGSFDVLGVLFFDKPSLDVPLVTQLNVDMIRQ